MIRTVAREDNDYPPLLSALHDPPEFLFVRGRLPAPNDACLAIVGSRKNTEYGQRVTNLIVPDLVRAGLTIVSGLAFGIDSIAHRATLAAGGRTIAILGSGVDRESVTPVSHTGLADQIVSSGGAVISEYPQGTPGSKFTYPARNRIIAGLSVGTLVVEAAERSGALITARSALNENREVFAVPQNITSPTAYGVNRLIQMGAHPVTSAEDVLQALGMEKPAPKHLSLPEAATPEEKKILGLLSAEPLHIDSIIQSLNLPSGAVMSVLTLLELNGMVQNLGGMRFVRLS